MRLEYTMLKRFTRDILPGLVLRANNGIDACDIKYINLEHRRDRRAEIEKELSCLGARHHLRFNAIRAEPGGLGCTLSHLAVLETAKTRNKTCLMVLEDDCEFLLPPRHVNMIVDDFFSSCGDVLCLAYNATKFASLPSKPTLQRVFDTQTTACYVIKPHVIAPLVNVAKLSADRFRAGATYHEAAIDQVWKGLQDKMVFCVPKNRAARQRKSFSDIEQTVTDYGV